MEKEIYEYGNLGPLSSPRPEPHSISGVVQLDSNILMSRPIRKTFKVPLIFIRFLECAHTHTNAHTHEQSTALRCTHSTELSAPAACPKQPLAFGAVLSLAVIRRTE